MSFHDDAWRGSYDAWKTADGDDPGRSDRISPEPWVCLDCPAQGKGYASHGDHWRATVHKIVWGSDPRASTAPWVSYDPDPESECMTGDGTGRR